MLSQPQQHTLTAFEKRFSKTPALVSFAPGRINVIGEHTDYNQGSSLTAAIREGVYCAFKVRQDETVNVWSENYEDEYNWREGNSPEKSWQKYVHGCISLFRDETGIQAGMDICMYGDIPAGFGISSSAALCVALLNGMDLLMNSGIDPMNICLLAQRAEREFAGTPCGLMDMMTSQFAEEGHFLHMEFEGNTFSPVENSLTDVSWVLINSGVKRELAETAYAERVKECRRALDLIKGQFRDVKKMRHVKTLHAEWLSQLGYKRESMRILHILFEANLVELCTYYVRMNNGMKLGECLNMCHANLRDLYEVSCMELDFLQKHAQKHPHCLGSRMMGGGFGGCTLNLVKQSEESAFIQDISALYEKHFNHKPAALSVQVADGAVSEWI